MESSFFYFVFAYPRNLLIDAAERGLYIFYFIEEGPMKGFHVIARATLAVFIATSCIMTAYSITPPAAWHSQPGALSVVGLGIRSAVESPMTSACDCDEPASMGQLTICIDGRDYEIEIFGCLTRPGIGQLLPGLCSNLQMNQYTHITKVCFIDPPPSPLDVKLVFEAILCRFDPCKNPGYLGANVPLATGSIYCWSVIFPKCVSFNSTTNCIERCGDGCCIIETGWERAANGCCFVSDYNECDYSNSSCYEPCFLIESCPRRLECCNTDPDCAP